MSNTLWTIIAALAVAASLVIALFGEVLILAGMANSSPAQLRTLKLSMLIIAAGTIAASAVSIVLIVKHHSIAGAIVGGLPAVVLVVIFVWLMVSG